MPKVSVIIPIYKVENYLEECLNSVVNQTLDDIEIICVDDGSPDRSGDIAVEYAKKHHNIKVIRKENGGLSSARNAGLDVARGKYIYFIDSDDYIMKDALESLYNRAEKEELDIIYFNTRPFFENDDVKSKNRNYIDYYKRKGDYSGVHTGQSMFALMRKENEFFGSACLQFIKRSLLEENDLRFYHGIIHEDNLFSFKCVMLAQRVGYINKAYYLRRVHDDSIMTVKKSMKNVEGYLVSYAEMISFMHNRQVEEKSAPFISEYLYNSIYKNGYNIFQTLNVSAEEAVFSNGDFCAAHFLDMVKRSSKVERDLRKEIQNMEKSMKNNKGYYYGNAIMIIPRKIKGGIQCIKEHGMDYTIHYGVEKIINFARAKGIINPFRSLKIKLYQKVGGAKPLVSIIVPVYNVEAYIEQGLDSLLNQSMKHIEIIAVDDGSTDHSLEILKRYENEDKRVRVFTQKNRFAGAARNLGLANAKGEYIIFLDSDDFFAKNLAKDAYYTAKMNDADVVLFGAKHYHNVTGEYKEAKWLLNAHLAPQKQPFNYKDCPSELYRITTPCPWTKMFRREFILKSGLKFQNLQNSNDLFFTYVALAMAERIVTLDKQLVYYRIGLENNLQTSKKKNPLCFYEAYKAWHDKLLELGLMDELRQSYVNITLAGCLYNLRSISDPTAKAVIFEKLKNEAFEALEVSGHEESYYYEKNNYEDMILVTKGSFEQYMEVH